MDHAIVITLAIISLVISIVNIVSLRDQKKFFKKQLHNFEEMSGKSLEDYEKINKKKNDSK